MVCVLNLGCCEQPRRMGIFETIWESHHPSRVTIIWKILTISNLTSNLQSSLTCNHIFWPPIEASSVTNTKDLYLAWTISCGRTLEHGGWSPFKELISPFVSHCSRARPDYGAGGRFDNFRIKNFLLHELRWRHDIYTVYKASACIFSTTRFWQKNHQQQLSSHLAVVMVVGVYIYACHSRHLILKRKHPPDRNQTPEQPDPLEKPNKELFPTPLMKYLYKTYRGLLEAHQTLVFFLQE